VPLQHRRGRDKVREEGIEVVTASVLTSRTYFLIFDDLHGNTQGVLGYKNGCMDIQAVTNFIGCEHWFVGKGLIGLAVIE
jgi:hypothetical protein